MKIKMKPEEIKLSDWMRILMGDVPPLFYLELVIRAFFIYFLLMLCMRLMGKRMSSQLSRLELAAMVSLASAIGVPMMAPDRGLVPAILIAFIVVGFTRLISGLSVNNENFERKTQGDLDMLVQDGVLRFDVMQRVRITRERLFAHLRSEKVIHLGAVRRVYMEAGGNFTVVSNEQEQPGLSILPDWDTDFQLKRQDATTITICRNCGIQKENNVTFRKRNERCSNCNGEGWTQAVVTRKTN
jgi:uncharacterized membrane protein YcaP (DUF421 family)